MDTHAPVRANLRLSFILVFRETSTHRGMRIQIIFYNLMNETIINTTQSLQDDPLLNAIEDIKTWDKTYKRDSLNIILKNRDRAIPLLIEILEDVLMNPFKYINDENSFGQEYSLYLLGHFKATEAHELIINLFSFDKDATDELWGDTITEGLPIILYNTSNNNFSKIKSLILNKEAEEFVRISAIDALMYGYMDGVLSKEEIQSLLLPLFKGDEAAEDSAFWDFAASSLAELQCKEFLPILENAYRVGLVTGSVQSMESYRKVIHGDKEHYNFILNSFIKKKTTLELFHPSIEWWACFNEDNEDFNSFSEYEEDEDYGDDEVDDAIKSYLFDRSIKDSLNKNKSDNLPSDFTEFLSSLDEDEPDDEDDELLDKVDEKVFLLEDLKRERRKLKNKRKKKK